MIALVDTNVLVSAALRDRLPERVVLYIATRDDCIWLVTSDILREYCGVLARPKLALSQAVLEKWNDLLRGRTVTTELPERLPVRLPRDPKDEPFLAAALASEADYLVTGDKDLKEAQSLVTTRIVTVAEFARLFEIT